MPPASWQGQLLGLSLPQDSSGLGWEQAPTTGMREGVCTGLWVGKGHSRVHTRSSESVSSFSMPKSFILTAPPGYPLAPGPALHPLPVLGTLRVAQDAQLGHLGTVGLFTAKYSKLKSSVAPRVSEPLQEGCSGVQ